MLEASGPKLLTRGPASRPSVLGSLPTIPGRCPSHEGKSTYQLLTPFFRPGYPDRRSWRFIPSRCAEGQLDLIPVIRTICAPSEGRKCFQSASLREHFEGEAAAGLGTGDADRRGAGELYRQGDGLLCRSAGVGGVSGRGRLERGCGGRGSKECGGTGERKRLCAERFAFSVGRLGSEGDASPCEGKMSGEASKPLQRTGLPTSNPRGGGLKRLLIILEPAIWPYHREGAAHGERSARLRLTVRRQQKRNVLRGVGFTQSIVLDRDREGRVGLPALAGLLGDVTSPVDPSRGSVVGTLSVCKCC